MAARFVVSRGGGAAHTVTCLRPLNVPPRRRGNTGPKRESWRKDARRTAPLHPVITRQPNEAESVRSDDLHRLPDGLPLPVNDGACDHLVGMPMPKISLPSTTGEIVDLGLISSPWLILFCYPRTGRPDQDPPGGLSNWNATPGARGCTPQACGYRDAHAAFRGLGATVYGLSTQETEYQREVVDRLQLPYALLSDAGLALVRALRLPTFDVQGQSLVKRLTLAISAGRVRQVWYPVMPPDADAASVLTWLHARH